MSDPGWGTFISPADSREDAEAQLARLAEWAPAAAGLLHIEKAGLPTRTGGLMPAWGVWCRDAPAPIRERMSQR